MIKKINDDRYAFDMVKVQMRWVDYAKIRAVFPAFKGESARAYFQRLADRLQVLHKEGDI